MVKNKIYLRVDGNEFGFVIEGAHEIVDSDILISDETYNKFFELQSQGKQFKVKNINGTAFDEIFEEYIPEPVPHQVTLEERNRADIDYIAIMTGVEL